MTNIITIDFETTYDREYSLAKMTTESYIRDPRFEVIGVAIKIDSNETDWYSGPDPGRFLRSLDWSDKWALAHHAAFDGFILSHHFGITPALWLDTMSMARPKHANGCGVSLKKLAEHYGLKAKGDAVIHALGKRRADFTPEELSRYADYCIGDVDITYDLFDRLSHNFPPQELLAISTTIKMFTEPSLRLDKMRLEAHLVAERERKERILARLGGDNAKSILNSNPKFAALLEALGVDPPMKTSRTTGKQTYAFAKTDKGLLDLQEHDDPRVRAVVTARLGTKSSIEETRTERFIQIAERGTLPIMLNYYGAHTGRFSGGDGVNLQNLPRGGELRGSLCAPDGMSLIACDLSQIEARILATVAGQTDLMAAFAAKRDPYSEFATLFYGRTITKADTVERFVGKTAILGLGYGLGWEKFKNTLAIGQGGIKAILSADQAQNLVHTYRSTNSHIVKFWGHCNNVITDMYMGGCGDLIPGVVSYDQFGLTLPNGMRIDYPQLKQGGKGYEYVNNMRVHKKDPEQGWTKLYGGKMTENCLAADAQVLTKRGWVRIADIENSDLLWDGIEWVSHDGLIEQPKQYTTVIDGVEMTPEHEVLTHDGWKAASSCAGLYRADFWLPDGSEVRGQQWAPLSLGVPLRLRDKYHTSGDRYSQATGRELRVQEGAANGYTQDDQTSGVCSVEVHAGSLPPADAPSIQELWGERYIGVPTMEHIRELLGGHGSDLPTGAYAGPQEQRRELRAGELPVGNSEDTGTEPPEKPAGGHEGDQRTHRNKQIDAPLSLEPQTVYDIRNAGPRSRFVVRGDNGPFIVHNCVQALARIVIVEMMVRIARRYKVVLQVHDEIIILVPDAEVPIARAFMEKVMSTPPKWLQNCPVACESGVGKNYAEAK